MENSLIIKNGHFEIDFDQLEKDIVDNQVKLYVFVAHTTLVDVSGQHKNYKKSVSFVKNMALYWLQMKFIKIWRFLAISIILSTQLMTVLKNLHLSCHQLRRHLTLLVRKTVLRLFKIRNFVSNLNVSNWLIINTKFRLWE